MWTAWTGNEKKPVKKHLDVNSSITTVNKKNGNNGNVTVPHCSEKPGGT